MKTLRKILLSVAVIGMGLVSASAQQQWAHTLSLGWGANIPAGEGNFRNQTAWVNPSVEWDYLSPCRRFSFGVLFGFQVSHERATTGDRVDGAWVTGYSDRQVTAVPIQARLKWFPLGSRDTMFRPYTMLGGGAQWARFDITGDAINSAGVENVGGLFSAGVGVRCFPLGRGVNADANALGRRFFVDLSTGWQWAGNRFEMLDTNSQRDVVVRLALGFSL
jgi:hypothetical protein